MTQSLYTEPVFQSLYKRWVSYLLSEEQHLKSGRDLLLGDWPDMAWDGQTLGDEEEHAEEKKGLEEYMSSKILVQMNSKDKELFKTYLRRLSLGHPVGTSSIVNLFDSWWSVENYSTSPSCILQGTEHWLALQLQHRTDWLSGLPNTNIPSIPNIFSVWFCRMRSFSGKILCLGRNPCTRFHIFRPIRHQTG